MANTTGNRYRYYINVMQIQPKYIEVCFRHQKNILTELAVKKYGYEIVDKHITVQCVKCKS